MTASEATVGRFASIVVAALSGFLYFQLDPAPARAQALAGGLLGLGGTTLGLLVAGLMFLIAGRGTRLISNMAITGHLGVLARRLSIACALWFACILTALSVLIAADSASLALTSIAGGLAVWAMIETAAVTWRMVNVITYWTPD